MILKQLELSNFQTIKNFKGNFDGNVYLVTGENEIGKSTLLKAIAILLTGSRDNVLSIDEEKGFAKAIIGADEKDYEVELKFTKANPKGTLLITDKTTGMRSEKISSFQDIFGYTDFDANEFASWSNSADGRRKQIAIIKSLLPVKTQEKIEKFDSNIIKLFADRKEVKSECKVFATLFKAKQKMVSDEDLETYAEPQDIKDVVQELTDAKTFNEQHEGVLERMEVRFERKEAIPDELTQIEKSFKSGEEYFKEVANDAKIIYDKAIAKVEKDIAESVEAKEQSKKLLNDELSLIDEKNKVATEWVADNEKEDIEVLKKNVENVELHNEKHKLVSEYLEAKENFEASEKKELKLDSDLSQNREAREALIKKSKLPVDGLSFSEDGLMLNGISFEHDKISTSQEMEVAVKLIMAKNPKTKVFRIARGESLGSAKMKSIVDFANENGYQGFIEEVKRDQLELVVTEYTEK